MEAGSLLDAAKRVVTGPREQEYGDKTINHKRIAALWNYWLQHRDPDLADITAYDVAMMMLLVKVARLMQTPGHEDSHVDLAGYAACLEEIAHKTLRKEAGDA